ncbi:ATP-binding cassette domain-containing protein [Xinfangfangia sp. CPCC 101601]|uniref:ATP-binding cassette domain-containing protein n=1 Tax=Pseudogemmobacter lacusdianii TaxID=3069608 RepID=A0ABU0W1I8_9RHOB|nr:oligopeptide/dipeptide ABC transporter ATP-binding protein [Xinfangfangia sp. CPCC 101601]MDQ2067633.1 ATP-binding cassette domain-containing protein [Xinfangfangia sp. CPCC 101601]
MSAPLLSVKDLRVVFSVGGTLSRLRGHVTAIEGVAGVSFDIAKGETFALVGESGSGKTTLARTLNGLQKVASGSIHFDGKDATSMGRAEMKELRRRAPMMFQDPVGSLSPRLDVRALLAEPFRIHGMSDRDLDAEVRRLLTLVGLPVDFASRYPHQLSGGQARRVGVARAVALDPQLIIADEPTAGLDVSVQGEVLNLLNDLRDRLGLSMLIITHNLHVVRQIADRTAVMYLGRFVEMGETEAIFRSPAHPYTAALLSANPEPDPDRVHDRIKLPPEVPSVMARPSGCEFHTRCPFAQDLCRRNAPPLRVNGGHQLTCHFPMNTPAQAGLEQAQ